MTSQSAVFAAPEFLKELVTYQQNSVVSRILLKQKSGSVTLFAFDQGEELSEHSTPYDALLCLIEGKARITVSGRPFELQEGQIIRLPANEPHAVQAIQKFKMMLVMLRG